MRENARGLHACELILIEEIVIAMLVAVEQPVASGRLGRPSLVQEGAERRNPGAGTDHDDRDCEVGGQAEGVGLLHIDLDLVPGRDPIGEIGRADSEPPALADIVAHRVDRERHALGIGLGRGRDRIEPRLHRVERFDEGFGVRTDAGKFFQRRQHVEGGSIPVRVAAGGKRLGFLPPLAAGQIRNELEQHVRRRVKRDAIDQNLAQAPARDREIRRSVDGGDHRVDQRGVVGRIDAE